MEYNKIFNDLKKLMTFGTIALIVLTWLTNLTSHSLWGFSGLWYELDVRIEGSFATWAESMLMFISALPAYVLFRDRSINISSKSHLFFLLLAFLAVFFSADEMLTIHEMLGSYFSTTTGIGENSLLQGFSWVLLYFPIGIFGFIFFFLSIRELYSKVPCNIRKTVTGMFVSMVVLFSGIIIFEILEGYIYHNSLNLQIIPSFEESFELLLILIFFNFLITLSKELPRINS